ncbi:hypothetical protein V6N11_072265 [Hibiscus sabdariffa]|uniref:Uncharacterized protein n=1 Tax=Hibiscus sabdariffa TaxID=183260 RepID=A0ABR2U389_9ROSI
MLPNQLSGRTVDIDVPAIEVAVEANIVDDAIGNAKAIEEGGIVEAHAAKIVVEAAVDAMIGDVEVVEEGTSASVIPFASTHADFTIIHGYDLLPETFHHSMTDNAW